MARFSGAPGEADYLVDGENVREEDVLYYVTRHQYATYMRRHGVERADVKRVVEARGAAAVFLDELPVGRRAWRSFVSALPRLLLGPWRPGNDSFGASLTVRGLRDFLDLSSLFESASVDTHLFLTFPNGHARLRTNSGVVTAACRRYNVRSAGYQTRLFYSSNFLFDFECLDLLCLWGQASLDVLDPAGRFVKQVVFVGDVGVDPLLRSVGETRNDGPVAVFPSDISPNHHYSYEYAMSFLNACCDAASSLPGLRLVVKPKDPWHVQVMRDDPSLGPRLAALGDRVEIASADRFDTDRFIREASIVVAIGFTTPGIDALLAGKPTVFFNQLDGAADSLTAPAGLTVESGEALTRRLAELAQPDAVPIARDALDRLDPYRDGDARSRILAAMGLSVDGGGEG
jgi:hypothetical protein